MQIFGFPKLLLLLAVSCILMAALARPIAAQAAVPPQESPAPLSVASLPLDPLRRAELQTALDKREYKQAETLLLEEIDRETARDPKSARAASLLVAVAGLFFLDGQPLNAAIAYKKAEAIAPLDPRNRFTLAMTYLRLERRDWARPELERLCAEFPKNALYLYWLARIEYDAQQYQAAIAKLEKVIALDPQMMRAYDNLGLCHDYLGQYDEAVKQYQRAIELNRKQSKPSPWPHLNLAITLLARNKVIEAESSLREAMRYDNRLPQVHYELGLALEKLGKTAEAIQALEQATQLDSVYPEPHYTLGLLYQKLGEKTKSLESFARFQRLKEAKRQTK